MKNEYRVDGDICYIKLKHKGELIEAIIDLDDFKIVNSLNNTWFPIYSESVKSCYVHIKSYHNSNIINNSLHRVIMKVTDHKTQVDHINHNTLDNRKSNLRLVTSSENKFNQSNRKGYHFHKLSNKWRAMIQINGKQIHLGMFETEHEAHNAYIEAKKIYHKIGGK